MAYNISLAEYEPRAKEVKATKNPEQKIRISTSSATMSAAIVLNAMMS